MKKVLVVFLVFFILQNSLDSLEKYRTKNSHIGCSELDTYKMIVEHVEYGDYNLFKVVFYNSLVSGQCIIFNEGEIIERISKNTGNIMIVKRMNGLKYWTSSLGLDLY